MGFSFGCGCCEISGCIYGTSPLWESCYSPRADSVTLPVGSVEWLSCRQLVLIPAQAFSAGMENWTGFCPQCNTEDRVFPELLARLPVSLLSIPEHRQHATNQPWGVFLRAHSFWGSIQPTALNCFRTYRPVYINSHTCLLDSITEQLNNKKGSFISLHRLSCSHFSFLPLQFPMFSLALSPYCCFPTLLSPSASCLSIAALTPEKFFFLCTGAFPCSPLNHFLKTSSSVGEIASIFH